MKTLLQITSSINSEDGQSTRLARRFVATWRAANPDGVVITRDLAADPVPHLDAERFGAFLSKPGTRTLEQQRVVDYSDALIAELKRADVVVLGLPMYNFGVPSTLKAYFDHIARAGVTFRYTEQGSVCSPANRSSCLRPAAGRMREHRATRRRTICAISSDFSAWTGSNSSMRKGSRWARRSGTQPSGRHAQRSND